MAGHPIRPGSTRLVPPQFASPAGPPPAPSRAPRRGPPPPPAGVCSASFVSDAGLILTNHHCVATCVEENSTGDNNILVKGFTARAMNEEKKRAGQQAEVGDAIRGVAP